VLKIIKTVFREVGTLGFAMVESVYDHISYLCSYCAAIQSSIISIPAAIISLEINEMKDLNNNLTYSTLCVQCEQSEAQNSRPNLGYHNLNDLSGTIEGRKPTEYGVKLLYAVDIIRV